MSNETKYTVEKFSEDPEVKAHIYQQLSEFEPYLLPGSQISVFIKQDSKSTRDYTVTFTLTADGARIQGQGIGHDIYQAAVNAKADILEQFEVIQNQVVNTEEREEEIKQIVTKKGTYTLH